VIALGSVRVLVGSISSDIFSLSAGFHGEGVENVVQKLFGVRDGRFDGDVGDFDWTEDASDYAYGFKLVVDDGFAEAG
jgi:hypothetical protein